MHFSSSLPIVAAGIILAAPVVSASAKDVIAPAEKNTSTEKETKTAPSPEELRKIIEKQEELIKALRARIKELEEAQTPSASATPTKE